MKEPNKSTINCTLSLIAPYSDLVFRADAAGECADDDRGILCCRHALLLWGLAAFFGAWRLGRGALPCGGLLCAHLAVAVSAGLFHGLDLGLFLRLQALVACREAVDRDSQYVLPLLQVCVLSRTRKRPRRICRLSFIMLAEMVGIYIGEGAVPWVGAAPCVGVCNGVFLRMPGDYQASLLVLPAAVTR